MQRRILILACAIAFGCDDGASDPPPIIIVPQADVGVDPDMAPVDMGAAPDMRVALDMAPLDAGLDMAVDAMPDLGMQAECGNGVDDDGDGLVDYPLDPGCETFFDSDEADPDQPACGNGVDDDDDGNTDHPDDPGCATPADPSEASACGAHVLRDVSAVRVFEGTTVGNPAIIEACRTNRAPEQIFLFTLRAPVANLHFDTLGTGFDTLLRVRRNCDSDSGADLACNDDAAANIRQSAVDLPNPALGDYYVTLDGFLEEQGPYVFNIRAEIDDGERCEADDPEDPAPGPVQCRLGSVCSANVCVRAACANGLDDDGDGRADYPNDPGCTALSDDDETSPDPLPQCGDGVDNDGNGLTDFPDDTNCVDAADDEEARPPQCRDGVDNDRDGLIDLADPGCEGDPERFSEFNVEACRDFQDNDEDGLTDYPTDPGCTDARDIDETDPDEPSQCNNGVDDDGDGLTDYPEDAISCLYAADETEDDPCTRREVVEITGLRDPRGNTEDAIHDFDPSCQANSGKEDLLLWRVADDRPLLGMTLNTRGSDFDTVLEARRACSDPPEAVLGCDDDGGQFSTSFLTLGPQAPGDEIFIIVDAGSTASEGIWRMRVTALLAEGANCAGGGPWVCGDGLACTREGDAQVCRQAACANGVDDDEDGIIDFPLEPGCEDASDADEEDPPEGRACSNAIDDDEDGLIDFPDDPGCVGAADDFEGPDCSDGRDNDGDGTIDYDRDGDGFRDFNADQGCACPEDPSEDADPQCDDGCDNDRDGLIDLADPGCMGDPARNQEFNIAHCRDNQDNDGDGNIDFPNDPGCTTTDDPLEDNPDPLPACGDGVDNDGDGRIDFDQFGMGDDGCLSAADPSEAGPCDVEQPLIPENGQSNGSTRDFTHDHVGTCRAGEAPEVVFRVPVPYPATVRADSAGSAFDTVVYARRACADPVVCVEVEPPPAPDMGVEADLGVEADAGVEADLGVETDLGVQIDMGPEADAGLPPAGGACEPGPSELACNDDDVGLQGAVEFEWAGGDVFVFLDGFGNNAGDYQLQVRVTYPAGGDCGPELHAYADCAMGTLCLPDPDNADRMTCQ